MPPYAPPPKAALSSVLYTPMLLVLDDPNGCCDLVFSGTGLVNTCFDDGDIGAVEDGSKTTCDTCGSYGSPEANLFAI